MDYPRIHRTIFLYFRYLGLIVLLLTGCTSIGPRQIHLDRARYNDIVRETDNAQVLKNLVRLRYLEPTSHLKVTSVTASYSLNSALAGNVNWPVDRNTTDTGSTIPTVGVAVAPSVSYTDSPTISYVPIDSADFVASLLQPINFKQLVLLFHGGIHDHQLIMRVVINRLGELNNASFATGTNSTDISPIDHYEYKKFLGFINLLQKMLHEKKVRIETINYQKQLGLIIHFNSPYSRDALALKALLKVPQNSPDIAIMDTDIATTTVNHAGFITIAKTAPAKNVVFARLRSVYGIMLFLSHAVQVPEEDVKANLVKITKDTQGRCFDWKPLLQGVMRIYSSNKEPLDAFVKTRYNGHWFFIRASDHNSKITFALLVRLTALTSGLDGTSQAAPVLTLPVNAGH
ncbi:TPA: hypothetical protein ACPSKB_000949 [Legionella feeleii]|uniref:Lipoprotein n=1 Tax=Legionella feeleii TaxID=453 RepID=A0A378IZE9_9GAMM|nr:hypothetical protein [Legionella feeleii]STX39871.1 Uncharacterised protein [Legionella feeleii]